MEINVTRSVVDQVVGRCKTRKLAETCAPGRVHRHGSARVASLSLHIASPRIWILRLRQQPGWKETREAAALVIGTIMRLPHPAVIKRLGIDKRVSWHTFRRTYTTLFCSANREDVKVVQELLRHSSVNSDNGHLRASANARQACGAAKGGGV